MNNAGLRLFLALKRQGYANCGAYAVFAIAVLGVAIALPLQHAALGFAQRTLDDSRHALSALSANPAVTALSPHARLAAFRSTLGDYRSPETQIKALFALAQQNNLEIKKAQYKSDFNKAGQYDTYQISIPLQGKYASIRAFCEQLLQSISFASIDSVHFSRDAINANTIDAKIVVTLYLADNAEPVSDDAPLPGLVSASNKKRQP